MGCGCHPNHALIICPAAKECQGNIKKVSVWISTGENRGNGEKNLSVFSVAFCSKLENLNREKTRSSRWYTGRLIIMILTGRGQP
jgi:hypothetical protein